MTSRTSGSPFNYVSPLQRRTAVEKTVSVLAGIASCVKHPPAFYAGVAGFVAPFMASRVDNLISRFREEETDFFGSGLKLGAAGPIRLLGSLMEEELGWGKTLVVTTAGEVLLLMCKPKLFAPLISFRAGTEVADAIRGDSTLSFDRRTLSTWVRA